MKTLPRCDKAPRGWKCTLGKWHEGPCAARRTLDPEAWAMIIMVAIGLVLLGFMW
jgi:hypothetical protein